MVSAFERATFDDQTLSSLARCSWAITELIFRPFKCIAGKKGTAPIYKIKTAKVQRSQLRLPECVICIDEIPDELKVGIANSQRFAQLAFAAFAAAGTVIRIPDTASI